MPRLQTLLECVGRAVSVHGAAELGRPEPLGDALLAIARAAFEGAAARLPGEDALREAFQEAVSVPPETIELAVRDAVADVLPTENGDNHERVTRYLQVLPAVISQGLRRPGDDHGSSVPEQFALKRPEDWLPYLPDRLPHYREDERLELEPDHWQVRELRGLGVACETWRGGDELDPRKPPACLKFVTDSALREDFSRHEDHFRRILELDPMSGVVLLQSVYLLADPPCLESAYLVGHDLTGLIRDWRWRYDSTRPGQAIMIIRRIARAVGALHRLDPPVVHRGLKPSNILIHPTAEGKASVWVADLGWGAITSAHCLLHPTNHVRTLRDALRGAHSPLYLSPQHKDGEAPDPRDDVYSLGVIWYQMLKRDPSAPPPDTPEWAMEFHQDGFTDAQARLLASCLDPRAEHRPRDGLVLADQIDANVGQIPADGSKTFVLKGSSSNLRALDPNLPPPSRRPEAGPVPREQARTVANSIGMKFVLIPAGTFVMGSPDHERGRKEWEGPQHLVRITRPFYLSVYPVTQAQYMQVTGKHPACFHKHHGGGPEHPVEQVSWDDAIAFCEKLNQLPVEAEACRIYRLPTEAEWEHACRAGTATAYCFGDSIVPAHAHFMGSSPAAGKREPGLVGKTARVGLFPTNPWGLYDMHGNILEWCADWWSEDYYDESPEEDPQGPDDGWQRVVRGGSFSQFAADCRSAARMGRPPGTRLNSIGFRVAMSVPGEM